LMCPLPFFFQCSVSLHSLPSFPTRRSSDLLRVAHDLDAVAVHLLLLGLVLLLFDRGLQRSDLLLHFVDLLGVRRALRAGGLGVEDRKSTRLNSSHLGISYAVFCLKKKTTRY